MAENRYELNKQLAISFHPELDNDNPAASVLCSDGIFISQ